MGLLKNVVLPVSCMLHSMVVVKVLLLRDYTGVIEMFGWPNKEEGMPNDELTIWETHSFGIIAGSHLSSVVGELFSIFQGDSQMRAVFAAMELIS